MSEMHYFTGLLHYSDIMLGFLREAEAKTLATLESNARTHLLTHLQAIQLQRTIMAVGMFSIFEAMIQKATGCSDGFEEAKKLVTKENDDVLLKRFSRFFLAINVLKHGRGRSYDALVSDIDNLPFRLKRPDENFFFEGDVAEISTLVQVDEPFVAACVDVIQRVSQVIRKTHPDVL